MEIATVTTAEATTTAIVATAVEATAMAKCIRHFFGHFYWSFLLVNFIGQDRQTSHPIYGFFDGQFISSMKVTNNPQAHKSIP